MISSAAHGPEVSEAEPEGDEDGRRDDDEEERRGQAGIRHVDAAAHDHDQDVDRRSDHAQDGAHGDEGRRLQPGQAELHQDGGDERAGAQDGRERGARDHPRKHEEEHDRQEESGPVFIEGFEDRRRRGCRESRIPAGPS